MTTVPEMHAKWARFFATAEANGWTDPGIGVVSRAERTEGAINALEGKSGLDDETKEMCAQFKTEAKTKAAKIRADRAAKKKTDG